MRKILFKAKRANNGEWIEGEFLLDSGIDQSTICQFTGLKDKNEINIFEDDVCVNEANEKGLILFLDGCYQFHYFDEPAKNYLHEMVIKDKQYNSTGVCTLEVVGNIHNK